MDFGEDNSPSLEIDYQAAWDNPQPFSYLKQLLASVIITLQKESNDYPYDSIFNAIITRGLISAAHEMDIDIEVRYKWEIIDEMSVATHSIFGSVVATDININDENRGFAIDGTHMGMDIMALSYDKVFYIGKTLQNPNNRMG